MFVTLLMSQSSGWLKTQAFSKVRCIFVTLLVSQPPIFALKVVFP